MDLWVILKIYTIIATSLSLTSYFMLYKPAIELVEEIVDKKTVYSGIKGLLLWNILTFPLIPYTGYILLDNDNEDFIESFAVSLAEKLKEK